MASPKRLTFDDRDDMPMAWLPGDRAVLFTSDRNGTTDIFRQELGQHAPEVLVGTTDEESDPRVTPDGAWIIFAAHSGESPDVALKRVPIDGGVAEEILRTPHFTHHRCGDRARCILEERGGRGTIVSELDPMSGRGRELFRKPSGTGAPAVSPDGERIAFVAGTTIRVVRLDGTTEREIAVQAVSELGSLDWTADGRGFFTTEVTLQKSRLLRVSENGNTEVLWSPPETQVAWGVPSRDGRRLALRAVTVDRNVWLLEGL
jgi:Tol biopolymer transport system component